MKPKKTTPKHKSSRALTVDVTMVLDRSGSMATLAADTIGGVNTFIKAQRKQTGTCHLTLHQFDHEFDTVYEAKSIIDAPYLTTETYVPRGNTALDDAIVKAVGIATLRRAKIKEKSGKMVLVIVTDGLENSSKEASPEQVKALLAGKEKDGWEIVYLGANQDAVRTGAAKGVKMANSMSYSASSVGTRQVYETLSKNVGNLRARASGCMAFDASDKAAQAKLGVQQ